MYSAERDGRDGRDDRNDRDPNGYRFLVERAIAKGLIIVGPFHGYRELVRRAIARGLITVPPPDSDWFKQRSQRYSRERRARLKAAGLTARGTPRKRRMGRSRQSQISNLESRISEGPNPIT